MSTFLNSFNYSDTPLEFNWEKVINKIYTDDVIDQSLIMDGQQLYRGDRILMTELDGGANVVYYDPIKVEQSMLSKIYGDWEKYYGDDLQDNCPFYCRQCGAGIPGHIVETIR